MIIDKIIVIIVAIILLTYLSVNYVRKYAPKNLIFISILAFSLGIYIPVIYFGYNLKIQYQLILLLGLFIIPCTVALLQYNNISFGKKLLYKKAQKLYDTQKYEKCITTVEKILAQDEDNMEMLFLSAKALYAVKEYSHAKEVLYDVIANDASNHEAYFKLGNILEKEDDIDSAIDMYEKTLEVDPTFYDAYEALGILLASEGRYSDAEAVYKKALNYHSESYELVFNLAMIQLEMSKTDEAEKNLELTLTINPEVHDAVYTLGSIKMLNGQYNEALTLFSEIINDEVYGLKAYYKIAIIYVTKNEFDKAMGVIEYLVDQDDNYINIIENEFIFNAMRSRIDTFLKNQKTPKADERRNELVEIEQKKSKRKNWFGRSAIENEETSVLYDDINVENVGFRDDETEKR